MSLSNNTQLLAVRIAQEIRSVRSQATGNNSGDLTSLATTDKSSLLAAINEVQSVAAAGGGGDMLAANNLSELTDKAAALTTLGGVTISEVNTAIQNIIDSAPAALDTLNELAAALGDDPNFASTINTALSKRVSVESQTFTAPEQLQARTNIDAASSTDVGDTDFDFVAAFEATLTA